MPTFAEMYKQVTQSKPVVAKPASPTLTANLERFPGIPESRCPADMREVTALRMLEELCWIADKSSGGSHVKLTCTFMPRAGSRTFAPSHSNRKKKTINKGELSHQSKIFGFRLHDVDSRFRREVRQFCYFERCRKYFPECISTIDERIKLVKPKFLTAPYLFEYIRLKELLVDAGEDEGIPVDPEIKAAFLDVRKEQPATKPVELPPPAVIVAPTPPIVIPTIVVTPPVFAVPANIAPVKIDNAVPTTPVASPIIEPEPAVVVESDTMTIQPVESSPLVIPTPTRRDSDLVRVQKYLTRQKITQLDTLDQWNMRLMAISKGLGIKKQRAEEILLSIFDKKPLMDVFRSNAHTLTPPITPPPTPEIQIEMKMESQTTSVTKQVKSVAKVIYVVNNKSYLDERVAMAAARLQNVEVQTLPLNDEPYEKFMERLGL